MTVFDYNNIKPQKCQLTSLFIPDCKDMYSNSFLPHVPYFNVHPRYSQGFLISTAPHTPGGLPGKDAQCYASSKPMTWSCRHIMPLTHNCLNEHCKWMDEDFAHPYLNIKRNHDVYTSISTKL